MPSADRVPVKTSHSTMLWPMWVVLITGSTGTALRAVSPFQPFDYAVAGAIWSDVAFFLSSQCDGFSVALASGHHRPGHACDLVGERDRSDFRRSAREQVGQPGPVLGAVDLGIADHGKCSGTEEGAQISIALLGDIAELLLATAGILLRHEANPRREVPARSERSRISNACDQRGGERGADTR